MFIYADSQACPGCRSLLPVPATSCTACGLDLTGPEPQRVFQLLKHVDVLVTGLYAAAEGAPVAAAAPLAPPAAPAHRPATLSASSVPKILLGLGALCLLVAALVFLAVAWAALGVEGRTLTLGVFALVTGALTVWATRRDLRAGAESLAAVTLGILALVVGGARASGWLGTLGDEQFLVMAGLLTAVAALVTARWSATTPVGTLISAEAIAMLGVVTAAFGLPGTIDRGYAVAALAALSLFALNAAAGFLLGLRFLTVGSLLAAAGSWLVLVAVGVVRILDSGDLTLAHFWNDLAVWPLLAATALVAAVAVPRSLPLTVRVAGSATAVALGTFVLTAVAFDESPTRLALVELTVVAAYAVIATRLPGQWKWATAAPPVIASLGLAVSVVRLSVAASVALLLNEPWGSAAMERLDGPDVPWTWPLLLPAGVIGIGVTVATVLHCAGRRASAVVVPGALVTGFAVALMPALYGAPLAVAVSAILVVTLALASAAVVLRSEALLLTAAATGVLTMASALPSDWVTAGVLVVLTLGAVGVRFATTWGTATAVASVLAPMTGAGLIWTIGHLAEIDLVWRALPVLLVLGVAMLVRPELEREVSIAVAAAVAVAGSVMGVGGVDQTWLAIYLTIAGVAATASSLIHADRRHLGWVGLGLLTCAQWIRLQQIGVGTVEAYTLPLALVLLVVGTVALLRGHPSSMTTLVPGLSLALVPSLLLVLVEPIGLRAVLLGFACLILIAIGMAKGWAAPLIAGALVGALVVLRQAAWAQVLPQWLLIGLVGLVLTVVGVTWEQRLQEIRKVSAYVRGLR